MTTQSQPKLTLEASRISPPSRLKEGSLFQSQEEYVAFLDETSSQPESFWAAAAREIAWAEKPEGTGRVGSWFEGGSLNISANCLDERLKNGGDQGAALWKLGELSGRPEALSRGELLEEIAAVEKQLANWRLSAGDAVLIALPPDKSLVVSALACLRRGLVCVPINPWCSSERLLRRVGDTACKGAIINATLSVKMKTKGPAPDMVPIPHWIILPPVMAREPKRLEAPRPVASMHPAFVLADTAGQKFTLPTAGFLLQAMSAYRHLLDGRGEGDILWVLSTRHHASLHSASIGALAAGGQLGLLPIEAAEDPEKFQEVLELARPRVMLIDVETVVGLVGKASKAGRSMRISGPSLLVVEGEMLEPRTWDFIVNELFDGRTHVVQALARPEAGGFIAGPHPATTPIVRSSVALAAPGIKLTIVNNKGHECDPGHGGLLALSKATPGLSLELQNIKPPIPIEVKARRDRGGYFWTMGEVEIRTPVETGMSIPEIEALIASIEGVDQVAVVRFPNGPSTSETKAFVKPMDGVEMSGDEIQSRISERFGGQLTLDSCQVVSRLPYSHSGKLLRSVLRRICTKEPLGSEDLRLVTDPEVIEELANGNGDK